jgi:hypothetical protein
MKLVLGIGRITVPLLNFVRKIYTLDILLEELILLTVVLNGYSPMWSNNCVYRNKEIVIGFG